MRQPFLNMADTRVNQDNLNITYLNKTAILNMAGSAVILKLNIYCYIEVTILNMAGTRVI